MRVHPLAQMGSGSPAGGLPPQQLQNLIGAPGGAPAPSCVALLSEPPELA